jgi:hypothetical protein
MRELVERFSYRFQLWQKECYGDHSPADPTAPRNPLRFVALVAVMSIILDATEPFLFHRAFDVVAIVRIPVALAFLIFYQSKSQWAWLLVVAWVLLGFFAYWALRLAGYSLYQPRVHRPVWDFVFALVYFGILAVVFVWLLRVRQRYFRYIEDATSERT